MESLGATIAMGAMFTAGSIAVAEGWNIAKDIGSMIYRYETTDDNENKTEQPDIMHLLNRLKQRYPNLRHLEIKKDQ